MIITCALEAQGEVLPVCVAQLGQALLTSDNRGVAELGAPLEMSIVHSWIGSPGCTYLSSLRQ